MLPQEQKVYETYNSGCPSSCQIQAQELNVCVRSTSGGASFHHILLQRDCLSIRFYLRSVFFLSDFTSERLSFCHILPPEIFFLSDFTSERLSFCQILRHEILLPVRFYLRKTVFLSNFTSGDPSSCQILPQKDCLSVQFYLRRSFLLSDFT